MSYSCFNLNVENHIARLEFKRPEACNSMNRDFWIEFPEAIRALDIEGDTRVLVISSQGKHFCSGMDLEVFTQPDQNLFNGEAGRRAESVRRLVMQLQECFMVLETARFPVISAIQGGCIGGALDLVCATDMRYCTEDAYFTVKETALGMTADLGTLQRLPGLIPSGLARELAYTARKMHAQEAQTSGLVNQTFPDQASMLDAVMGIAQQIAAHSPLAITGTKQMINYARDHSLHDSLSYMATWQSGMFQPNDMMQSFSAKVSGKAAVFEPLRKITQPLQAAD
ncbi:MULTISPECIES: crotonase/enoyl-CoA hydratase family protein [unclassified Marinobacterium]|uniref:crotonase/enoyl-CoA hydratase family protein n=1 Tax=unclassified Marinobacterium TaxID=2644139 RepID=UPI001568228F|nr:MULTISPECIES: crotonase/enoyl-CoA hydratase family protein [unclassified Marinobacterium]NRP09413.1 Carnitinyl-CoA dehydratase [Marinobacterium sp. xm-g-48]NRP82056.1 Carnitinyl-CoA dehydratase [Marinobacterium sp. xm-d-509]